MDDGLIGQGSFSNVFPTRREKNNNNQEPLAKKVMKKSKMITKLTDRRNLLAERKALALLRKCVFVSQLKFAYHDHDNIYLADYCAGSDLSRRRCLTENECRFYTAEIILALQFIHEREIIFHELKCENVLISDSGHIKLTNFGLCKDLTDATSCSYERCGTRNYMAPEIIQHLPQTKAIDWWTLGIMLMDMNQGGPPFSNNKQILIRDKFAELYH